LNGNGGEKGDLAILDRTGGQKVDGTRVVGTTVLVLASGAFRTIATEVLQRSGKAKPGVEQEHPEGQGGQE
jgi:hypothetical protein